MAALFARFPRLLPEIRLMIWEATWLEPCIIEAAYADEWVSDNGVSVLNDDAAEHDRPPVSDDDSESDDGGEYVRLRLTCSLSTWLQTDIGPRILEDRPLEECLFPVALYVCCESWAHTLRQFTAARHSKLDTCAFYFNP